jgi:hypothetical protein
MESKVTPVSLDPVSWSHYGAQVAQRVQYVVGQVMNSHSGAPEPEVVRVLIQRLRGLGVNPNVREVSHLAEVIAKLPKSELPKSE